MPPTNAIENAPTTAENQDQPMPSLGNVFLSPWVLKRPWETQWQTIKKGRAQIGLATCRNHRQSIVKRNAIHIYSAKQETRSAPANGCLTRKQLALQTRNRIESVLPQLKAIPRQEHCKDASANRRNTWDQSSPAQTNPCQDSQECRATLVSSTK